MKIGVIGTGYVGLTVGTGLANLGNEVTCADIDNAKIEILNKGEIPIYEPGLKEIVDENVREGRLKFTTDVDNTIRTSDVIYIAVGTPSNEDGSADLKHVEKVAETIGKNMDGYKVIVDKSTVPVGTGDWVRKIVALHYDGEFDVVSNPEFLREGAAVKDFFNPDRTVIGCDSERAKEIMGKIYKAVERVEKPIVYTDIRSAEMIKYASNAFLATKISFINEIANLCEKVGADVKAVARGMGLDTRIGSRFLQAGVGYGGSCFPKDVRAIIKTGKDYGYPLRILDAVELINKEQRQRVIPKLKSIIPDLNGKTFGVWGLAFKPKTDDIREAPALTVIDLLVKEGARVKVFDPVAEKNARKLFQHITYCKTPYDAAEDSDALLIMTEWDQFRELDMSRIKYLLKNPVIIDGRNVYDVKEMKELGFKYLGFGRGVAN